MLTPLLDPAYATPLQASAFISVDGLDALSLCSDIGCWVATDQ